MEGQSVIYRNETIVVLNSSNYNYPIFQQEISQGILLILEGRIFGESFESIAAELKSVGADSMDDRLTHYSFNLDGEFFFYKIDTRSNKILVVGDHLNRLPLYFGSDGQQWIVSRQISIAALFMRSKINKVNLAEFMVFDYNLSDRTWFDNLYFLQIDDFIEVDTLRNDLRVKRKPETYDFGNKTVGVITEDLLLNMADIFLQACSVRADEINVLSMSGGMDSRSVAAGLVKNSKALAGVTFENAEKTALYDSIIAEEIADSLGIKWHKVALSRDSFLEDVDSLMNIKMSIQPCRFYYLYQFCAEVQKKFGNDITFFTGDGGDKVFPDLGRNLKFNDDYKLFKFIIRENHEFSVEHASAIVGISSKDLENQIFSYIRSLPAKTSSNKLEQFILRARMKRYIFEGEDRNRNYFWSTTPFLSKRFFSLMMSISPQIKRQELFYFEFISRLNREVAEIRNENFSKGKFQVNKGLYSFIKGLSNQFLSRKSKEHLKSIFKSSSAPSDSARQYVSEIKRMLPANNLLDKKALSGSLSDYSTGQLSLILTYLKVSEFLKRENSEVEYLEEQV
ncbi:hypothetical protein GCM10009119_26870 [Algoriphagus jejuensis]|uniref:asparagine synthase (glutamine-hydrolyzing) n=1 Tax=Algoriphagus jejuensis TaxID=419934 RepID=A0ABP3YE68_9BACT